MLGSEHRRSRRQLSFQHGVAKGDEQPNNETMTPVSITNVPLPTDLVLELDNQAKRAGLPLSAYLAMLSRVAARQHDQEFVSATRYVFSKYPNALRKLAQ